MSDDPMENMRHRAAECRRLAAITHDDRMKYQLLDWAAEIEVDIQRLTTLPTQVVEPPKTL